MAGEARLEGEVGEKALSMLKEITSVLEKFGVDYVLDCGTLLGIMRENRLLPWDNDVDLAVDSSQLTKLKRCMFLLWFKGYRVRFAKSTIETASIPYGAKRIFRIRNRKGIFHRGDNLIDIFIKYDAGDGFHYVRIGEGVNSVEQRFPTNFLREKSTVDFEGKQYPIPKNYDEYLTYRYGDWRIPVKEWDYISQDKSKVDSSS